MIGGCRAGRFGQFGLEVFCAQRRCRNPVRALTPLPHDRTTDEPRCPVPGTACCDGAMSSRGTFGTGAVPEAIRDHAELRPGRNRSRGADGWRGASIEAGFGGVGNA